MVNNTQKLIEDNIGLVGKVISDKRLYSFYSQADTEDIYQCGCLGLCKAAELFDESKGVKFATFAYRVIHNSIRTHYKNNQKHDDLVRLDKEIYSSDGGIATTQGDLLVDNSLSASVEISTISSTMLPVLLEIIDEIINDEHNHTRRLTYIMWRDRGFKAQVGSEIAKELGVTRAITCKNINMFKEKLAKKLNKIGWM